MFLPKSSQNLDQIEENLLPELELDPDQEDSDLPLIQNPNNGWIWLLKENWNSLSPKQELILKNKLAQLLEYEKNSIQINEHYHLILEQLLIAQNQNQILIDLIKQIKSN